MATNLAVILRKLCCMQLLYVSQVVLSQIECSADTTETALSVIEHVMKLWMHTAVHSKSILLYIWNDIGTLCIDSLYPFTYAQSPKYHTSLLG